MIAVDALDSRPAKRPPAHRTQGFADGVRGVDYRLPDGDSLIAVDREAHTGQSREYRRD